MTLTADQCRAHTLLASDARGGFRREMLAGLVLAGLATIETGTMKAGAATVKVERDRITDDGHPTRG